MFHRIPATVTAGPLRTSFFYAGLVLLTAGLMLAAERTQAMEEDSPKVVWHVDFEDIDRMSAMLGSINNMIQTYEDRLVDYDVRVVLLADGIKFLTDEHMEDSPFEVEPDSEYDEERQEIATRLLSLNRTYGVKLELCDITRRAAGVEEDQVYEEVDSVESGVVRVAELQNKEGFAYLKMK